MDAHTNITVHALVMTVSIVCILFGILLMLWPEGLRKMGRFLNTVILKTDEFCFGHPQSVGLGYIVLGIALLIYLYIFY